MSRLLNTPGKGWGWYLYSPLTQTQDHSANRGRMFFLSHSDFDGKFILRAHSHHLLLSGDTIDKDKSNRVSKVENNLEKGILSPKQMEWTTCYMIQQDEVLFSRVGGGEGYTYLMDKPVLRCLCVFRLQ